MDEQDIEKYLNDGKYIGVIEGNYDFYCELELDEINSFVQNVGLHTNVEIIRGTDEDVEVLFNTYGTYINRIWPELSFSDRDGLQSTINRMASRLVEEFDEDKRRDILPKVEKFLTEVMEVDITKHKEIKEQADMMNSFYQE